MNDFDDNDEIIGELIQQGAIEVYGFDSETGEMLYTFTEKLQQVNPKIYNAMMDDFHASIMRLWEQGFLSMDVTAKNPLVHPTDKIYDIKAISSLSQNDQITLRDILSKMSE